MGNEETANLNEKTKRTRRTKAEMELAKENDNISEEYPFFSFIGNGNDDPKEITVYGYTFVLNGDPIEIKDKFAIMKLSVNSHFLEI